MFSGESKCPVLVNVGNGDIVTEASMVKLLEQELLSATMLHRFEKKPVPESSLIWIHPRVLMAHHNSCVNSKDSKCYHTTIEFSTNSKNFQNVQILIRVAFTLFQLFLRALNRICIIVKTAG